MKQFGKYKVVVDKNMRDYGSTDLNKKVIKINPKKSKSSGKGELLNTILHETLHTKHPKKSEKAIIALTAKKQKTLSVKSKQKLLSLTHGKSTKRHTKKGGK